MLARSPRPELRSCNRAVCGHHWRVCGGVSIQSLCVSRNDQHQCPGGLRAGFTDRITPSRLVSHHEIDVLFHRCQNGVHVVNRVIGVESDA